MSWKSYIDEKLIETNNICNAVIITTGSEGGTLAASDGFELKSNEGKLIVALFKRPDTAFAKGVTVAGIKYDVIKADGDLIYGKNGDSGVALYKSCQAIVIGVYDETKQHDTAISTVEKLGDFLVGIGK